MADSSVRFVYSPFDLPSYQVFGLFTLTVFNQRLAVTGLSVQYIGQVTISVSVACNIPNYYKRRRYCMSTTFGLVSVPIKLHKQH